MLSIVSLDDFIAKNKIKISKEVYDICKKGISTMKNSQDPHHGIKHIDRMLDDLYLLAKKEKELQDYKLDWEVLLMSIMWHDVWKTTRSLRKNILSFIYGDIYHGAGGSKMYKRYSNNIIDDKTIRKAAHNIRKHSSLLTSFVRRVDTVIFPPTVEFKLLMDVDGLDSWNVDRLDDFKTGYLGNNFDKRLVLVGKFWYYFFMKRTSEKHFYFSWSKKEFIKRKKLMMNAINDLWDNRGIYGVG